MFFYFRIFYFIILRFITYIMSDYSLKSGRYTNFNPSESDDDSDNLEAQYRYIG